MMTSAPAFILWKVRKALCSLSSMRQPSTKGSAFVVRQTGLNDCSRQDWDFIGVLYVTVTVLTLNQIQLAWAC